MGEGEALGAGVALAFGLEGAMRSASSIFFFLAGVAVGEGLAEDSSETTGVGGRFIG